MLLPVKRVPKMRATAVNANPIGIPGSYDLRWFNPNNPSETVASTVVSKFDLPGVYQLLGRLDAN